MTQILNGKDVTAYIKQQVKTEIENKNINACLAVIVVGNDPASQVYVRNKKKACEEVGIKSVVYELEENSTEEDLLFLIDMLSVDPFVQGILVQLPLPKHIDESKVIAAIPPEKDVDGFNIENTGKLWSGMQCDIVACTPAGVVEMLDYYNIDIAGKHCVIVGRSNIVGKPMAALLLDRNGTVTICHSKTKNLAKITKQADILVVAIGNSKFITADMVKNGAVVIDVGINRDENGKLCGDVDFENVKEKTSWITPVPGGCGPMTVAMLMKNVLGAVKIQK